MYDEVTRVKITSLAALTTSHSRDMEYTGIFWSFQEPSVSLRISVPPVVSMCKPNPAASDLHHTTFPIKVQTSCQNHKEVVSIFCISGTECLNFKAWVCHSFVV